jgi:uncharacterized membrane protein YraQ (UPF0718 family)
MGALREIADGSIRDMELILPVFLLAVLVGAVIELYLPEELVMAAVSFSPYLAVFLAAVLGVLFPVPRYANYPIAASLYLKGAGLGVVFALISGSLSIAYSMANCFLLLEKHIK